VKLEDWRGEYAAWKEAREAWNALSKEEQAAREKADPRAEPSYFAPRKPHDYHKLSDYKPFNPDNIYYDDTVKHLAKEAGKYNRIALIIQGLYDRSEVLHPHPPVQTWTPEGFASAIELHYDQDHALTSGDPPDFAAYLERINETLAEGSMTIGQADYWDEYTAKRNEKNNRYVSYGRGPKTIDKIDKWQPPRPQGDLPLAGTHQLGRRQGLQNVQGGCPCEAADACAGVHAGRLQAVLRGPSHAGRLCRVGSDAPAGRRVPRRATWTRTATRSPRSPTSVNSAASVGCAHTPANGRVSAWGLHLILRPEHQERGT